ncbi:sulfotransferase [Altererythrobacter sp.]|nr:sulfotransferase [Altererythrobacter sp.]
MTHGRFAGRYVFVAGLHRTGTSLTARLLGESEHVASIARSPAPENEGSFLQGAIPHTALHGIPGQFATDPAQHLVEGCAYDTQAVRDRMEADWDKWFERSVASSDTPWRLEKSPVNLTRMRLYQQLFPMAQFVIILRHPSTMAAALAKWTDTLPSDLIDYALDAYEQMLADLAHLHAATVVRYEDLVANPDSTLAGLFAFLDLPVPALADAIAGLRDGNADYPDATNLTAAQLSRATSWGYGTSSEVEHFTPIVRHPLRAVREATISALQQTP